jgi:predicted amidohydrolase
VGSPTTRITRAAWPSLPTGSPALVEESRQCDIARARENGMSVIRADVAGRTRDLVSYGASEIVDQNGVVLAAARPLAPDLVVADIATVQRATGINSALGEL